MSLPCSYSSFSICCWPLPEDRTRSFGLPKTTLPFSGNCNFMSRSHEFKGFAAFFFFFLMNWSITVHSTKWIVGGRKLCKKQPHFLTQKDIFSYISVRRPEQLVPPFCQKIYFLSKLKFISCLNMYFLRKVVARFYTHHNHRANKNVRMLYKEKNSPESSPRTIHR